MKASTKLAIGVVGVLSLFSYMAIPPAVPALGLYGYKHLAVKKIIAKKNVRSGSTGRTYSGGGSSYGK